MKKISVIPLLVLILTSCSWFQKDDVKQALTPLNVSNKNIDGELIEDSEVNSEGQGIGDIEKIQEVEMVESTLQKKVEISEEQKAKNLSIKEQFIAEFNKKNVDLFPKNYTISTETIRGDYESNKITTIGFGEYIAKIEEFSGVGFHEIEQAITDKMGQKINKLSYSNIPEKIRIGNIEYNYYSSSSILRPGYFMPDAIPKDSSYMLTGVSIENIDISINKLEYLPKIIHIKFDEFPIYLSYKPEIDIKKSLLILNIIPEEEKFVQNGEIMDEDFTKKLILNLLKSMESRISGDLGIITQYFGESNAEDYCYALDEEEKEVVYFNNINQCSEYLNGYGHSSYSYEKNIIKEADLPMFYLEKIDYNGNYSLSFTKDYLLSPVW